MKAIEKPSVFSVTVPQEYIPILRAGLKHMHDNNIHIVSKGSIVFTYEVFLWGLKLIKEKL